MRERSKITKTGVGDIMDTEEGAGLGAEDSAPWCRQVGWIDAFGACHLWGWWEGGERSRDVEVARKKSQQAHRDVCDVEERKMEAGRGWWSLGEWKMFGTWRIWLAVSKRPQTQASQHRPHWAHCLYYLSFSPACWKPSPLQAPGPKPLSRWNLPWEPVPGTAVLINNNVYVVLHSLKAITHTFSYIRYLN